MLRSALPLTESEGESKQSTASTLQINNFLTEAEAQREAAESSLQNERMRLTRKRSIQWIVNKWSRKQLSKEAVRTDRSVQRAVSEPKGPNPFSRAQIVHSPLLDTEQLEQAKRDSSRPGTTGSI
jgi:hypothetical protein